MNLEELFAAAEAGDPEAIAMLQALLTPQTPGAGPYRAPQNMAQATIPQQMLPAFEWDKQGNPDYAKNLNYYQDATGEQADMMTAGMAGGGAFAPGALSEKEVWEPLKTPTRNFLIQLSGKSGQDPTSWEGWVAQTLLEGGSMTDAELAAKGAIAAGMPGPIIEVNPATGQPVASADKIIKDFALKNVEGLSSEPFVDTGNPNIRQNPDTGQYEMRGEPQRTEAQQYYDKLGLPMPNEEYNHDWLMRNSPDAAARYDQSMTQEADAEAMLRKLTPTVDARGNYLPGHGPHGRTLPGAPQGTSFGGGGARIGMGVRSGTHTMDDSGGGRQWGVKSDTHRMPEPSSQLSFDEATATWGDTIQLPDHGDGGELARSLGVDPNTTAYQNFLANGTPRPPSKASVLAKEKEEAEKRRRSQFNMENTNKKIAALNSRKQARATRNSDAMDMWIMSNILGRTPFGDATQARQNVVQQAGGAPPWGY